MLLTIIQLSVSNEVKAAEAPYLISLNRTTYSSSSNGDSTSAKAVDGDTGTRWESEWGKDDQWMYVDLGATASMTGVKINWEGAYATAYQIEVSNDEGTWSPIYSKTNATGGNENITLTGTGRYVRLHCTQRALAAYGYSVFEFQVFGTGGVNPPPAAPLGPNVALNKPTTASSIHQDWYITPGQVDPNKAVDGDMNTRWGSALDEQEWIYVDLGSTRTIGRVILNWDSAARSYDLEVSNDAVNWTKVYRQLNCRGGEENIPLYATGRYVRMNGITRDTTFEFGLREFRVYDYVAGDPRPTYTIPAIPAATVTAAGQGSYVSDANLFPQPKEAFGRTSNINAPIPSNDWWQSILMKNLGDALITLPLKAKYQQQGLGILTPSAGWVQDRTTATEKNIDLFLMANNINTTNMNSKISGYGDYSATVVLSDNSTEKMKTTFVKGSPYIFSQFSDPNSAEIYSTAITRIFNDSNQAILSNNGDVITADHIGIEITNSNGAPTPSTIKRYYGVFAPAGTIFKRVGSKIKMQLGTGQGYLSIATMPSASNLNYFYQHGYAFVTDTKASYTFDGTTSKVTTNFNLTTSLKRTDLSSTTLMCLQPVQWKVTPDVLTSLSYPSVRGTLKVREGNSFSTVDTFNGIVPQFTEPTNPEYSRSNLLQYLATLDKDTSGDIRRGDAYWQGKVLHPLGMGVLIADQIGATDYRDKFLSRIKTVLTDWYTYTPGETEGYYFNYNSEWGTLIYKHSEFGANVGITDHHFTYGYYTFASAVLATYDQDFYTKYGPMVDNLIRDYANPSRTDGNFPMFRNFDPYEGHSWAGGYADNNDGNNQEAAGESLFGWVGAYLWGLVSGNTAYRDAGIYGFTTELRSIEQYWFNYDGDNWLPDYNHKTVGQVYAGTNFYGTFFNGNSVYVYGIHWLPTAEYLTSYGFDKTKVANLYEGMKNDIINDWNTSTDPNKGPAPNPNDVETDWRHVTWPIQSLSDPAAVLAKWDASRMQANEVFNTYWFVNSMATLGQRTREVWATNGVSSTVYKKGTAYRALVWNPGNSALTVTFRNASGVVGSATVPAKKLVSVNPFGNNNVVDKSALAAKIYEANALVSGDYTAASWSTFSTALTAAKNVNSNAAATQAQVDTALQNLTTAMAGLVKNTSSTGVNLALNKTAVSSSNEADGLGAQYVVDGVAGTRWSSNWAANTDNHPEYVYVDLGQAYNINKVNISWDVAYAAAYEIQVCSANPTVENSWSRVAEVTNGTGGNAELTFATISARYVRVYCKQTSTPWGYSFKEIEVYGSSTTGENNTINRALNKTAVSSSNEADGLSARYAVDGVAGTRWSSNWAANTDNHPEYVYIDLGQGYSISNVKVSWDVAYATSYEIQVCSANPALESSWTKVAAVTNGTGGLADLKFTSVSARYVRVYCKQASTPWGYSFKEIEVY
jgi:endoglucanase Acf2